MTAISASAPAQLVKMANGEYTAASVLADPTDASKLALVKEKDGNYGTSPPPVAPSGNAATQSSANVQAALTSLKLGGQ
jgi:hypothetical protein